MYEGYEAQAWNHTASLMALLANANRDPKKTRAFKMTDFHPHHARRSVRPSFAEQMESLKARLPRGKPEDYPWLPGEREAKRAGGAAC